MQLTNRISGKWSTRLDQAKKLGAKHLLDWNDIVKIYNSNDKNNIEILEKDMKDSWLVIPAPDILLSEDNPIIKRIAGNRKISIYDISKSNKYVVLYFGGDGFGVSGCNWVDSGGYSHSVSSNKSSTKERLKKCSHCKGTGMVKRR